MPNTSSSSNRNSRSRSPHRTGSSRSQSDSGTSDRSSTRQHSRSGSSNRRGHQRSRSPPPYRRYSHSPPAYRRRNNSRPDNDSNGTEDTPGSDEFEVSFTRRGDSGTARARAEGRYIKRDPLSRYARHWTRTRDMWVPFTNIIDVGMALPDGPEQGHLQQLWHDLQQICPTLDKAIEKRGIGDVAAAMERARNNARGEDIKRLKDNINKIFSFSPPISDIKETRGFHDMQICKLLLPPKLASDWDFDTGLRQRYQQGLETPNPLDYGIWMYPGSIANPDNLLAGFLRSNALIRAFRMIFHGPSAVDGRGPSVRATKKGNAQLNSMRKVTIASIAYVATLLRFALDSASTFSAGGAHGAFNYSIFYDSIVQLLGCQKLKDFTEELLTWWNHQVFPNQEPGQVNDADTVHAQMLAQMAATNLNDDELYA